MNIKDKAFYEKGITETFDGMKQCKGCNLPQGHAGFCPGNREKLHAPTLLASNKVLRKLEIADDLMVIYQTTGKRWALVLSNAIEKEALEDLKKELD